MTRDDIIRITQEAGLHLATDVKWMPIIGVEYAEKLIAISYAKAVTAEREKVARWMIQRSYATGHGDTTEDLLRELAWQADERIAKAVTAEREECAKVCEEIYTGYEASGDWPTPEMCAAAIRARALTNLNKAAEDNGEPL